jgi:hypothetical protein
MTGMAEAGKSLFRPRHVLEKDEITGYLQIPCALISSLLEYRIPAAIYLVPSNPDAIIGVVR